MIGNVNVEKQDCWYPLDQSVSCEVWEDWEGEKREVGEVVSGEREDVMSVS